MCGIAVLKQSVYRPQCTELWWFWSRLLLGRFEKLKKLVNQICFNLTSRNQMEFALLETKTWFNSHACSVNYDWEEHHTVGSFSPHWHGYIPGIFNAYCWWGFTQQPGKCSPTPCDGGSSRHLLTVVALMERVGYSETSYKMHGFSFFSLSLSVLFHFVYLCTMPISLICQIHLQNVAWPLHNLEEWHCKVHNNGLTQNLKLYVHSMERQNWAKLQYFIL